MLHTLAPLLVAMAAPAVPVDGLQTSTRMGPQPLLERRYVDGRIHADGRVFGNWSAYRKHLRRRGGERACGVSEQGPIRMARFAENGFNAAQLDCAGDFTRDDPAYEPEGSPLLVIDVVFHVIRTPEGLGHIDVADVQHSIDRLNQDFRAVEGSLGANGTDSRIEFRLARFDPDGDPAFGIRYHDNAEWFADPGHRVDAPEYARVAAWDPSRYLNIYSNDADGNLGYASIPQYENSPDPGSIGDRVVIRWDTIGRNPPIGDPYHLGRTLAHEVGHWCGLWHVFTRINDGVCDGDCRATGDTICDTGRQTNATRGCGDNRDCGTPNSFRNYMDYSDDDCQDNFTPGQVGRMRCTIMNWRPDVFEPVNDVICNRSCPADLDLDGVVDGTDFGLFVAEWGPVGPLGSCADLNGDGSVDGNDVGAFFSAWGICNPCPEGWSEDCMGQCFPNWVIDLWTGDGICDDGLWIPAENGCGECPAFTPIYLDCTQFDLDGGDCANP